VTSGETDQAGRGATSVPRRIVNAIDRLSEVVGRLVSWLTLVMVVVTFVIVLLRYLFNLNWIALQESVLYMHALIFMLGAAYTLRHAGHVRIDIFYRRFGRRGQAMVDLLGTLLLLIPVCSHILYVSWDYVATSWSLYEGSREAGGLPGIFLIKSAIIVMAAGLLLQGVAEGLKALATLAGDQAGRRDDG
jgi:TRAP-type mannitol/chloroaromatic compound transport system permease small subunit